MYHIKNDKRAKTSANLIYDALIKLLKKKPLNKITISEVLKISTVSRATFYRNFDTLLDVLIMKCDYEFEGYITSFLEKKQTAQESISVDFLLRHMFEYWYNHQEIVRILVTGGHREIIFDSFIKNPSLLTRSELPELDAASDMHRYLIASKAGAIIGLFVEWVNNDMKHTPDEMTRIFMESTRIVHSKNYLLF